MAFCCRIVADQNGRGTTKTDDGGEAVDRVRPHLVDAVNALANKDLEVAFRTSNGDARVCIRPVYKGTEYARLRCSIFTSFSRNVTRYMQRDNWAEMVPRHHDLVLLLRCTQLTEMVVP